MHYRIIESQIHSCGKGRQEASSQTTCSKDQLESDQLTQGFIQLSLEKLQGWMLHILSKQPIPLPDCSHRERDFSQSQSMLMVPNHLLLYLCRDKLQEDSPPCFSPQSTERLMSLQVPALYQSSEKVKSAMFAFLQPLGLFPSLHHHLKMTESSLVWT